VTGSTSDPDSRRMSTGELLPLLMRFQVLTAASMYMTVSWDVSPCNLVEIDRRHFRGNSSSIIRAMSHRLHYHPDYEDSKHF
jgi:hypothetical protein